MRTPGCSPVSSTKPVQAVSQELVFLVVRGPVGPVGESDDDVRLVDCGVFTFVAAIHF